MAFDESVEYKLSLELQEEGSVMDQDFTVRSEPNSRTSSIKYKSRKSHLAVIEDDRRRNSLPLSTEKALSGSFEDHLDGKRQQVRRVRSFRMTPKGIKKDLDDERRLSSASIGSVLSQTDCYRKRLSSDVSDDSAICCGCSTTSSSGYYRICVMGADAVGKTTLTNQFMSSEYLCSYEFENEELGEQTLSVVVDSEESTLEFIDRSNNKYNIEKISADAFIVVFSVHERETFVEAKDNLMYLRNELFNDRAIVLVANKVDLVRKRQITSEEAKEVAKQFDCKYIETSAALNHKVDELLVGILKEIKTKLNPEIIEQSTYLPKKEDKQHKGPKGLLSKLFRRKSRAPADVLLDVK